MKKVTLLGLGFLVVISIIYYIHETLLTQADIILPFSLKGVYLFFGVFSMLLCVLLYALSLSKRFSDQIGFLYLASVAVKIIGFSIFFYKDFFNAKSLTLTEGISLMIPIALSIFFEVLFLSRILKKKGIKKMME